MSISQKSFDSIKNSLEIILDKDLISSDQFKKAKNDFLKSPSDYTVQYRYGMAMVHSKEKINIEEGLKLLKELCLLNTLPESCMCYYHICFGSLRLHKWEDVQYYAERVREECPRLMPDEVSACQLIEKTDQLVALAEEFIQNPQLSKLLESKRKRRIKGLWRPKKENEKFIPKQPSVVNLFGVNANTANNNILSDGTNINRKSFTMDSSSSYSHIPSLTLPKKATTTPLYNTLCLRNPSAKRPRNHPTSVKSCATLPDYKESELPEYNDGELNELKESLSQLREMYNSTFGVRAVATCVDLPNLSDATSCLQTPRAAPKSSTALEDLLNDALSEEDPLQDFPGKSVSQEVLQLQSPYTREYSISTPASSLQPTRRKAALTKCTTLADKGERPWVIIRRYGMRGGKKIRLPQTMEELLQLAGQKFLINPVSIREVDTEAEIEEISAIEAQAVLWVMTEEDELLFQ